MTFKQAYEALKQGADIRRKHWKGFWKKERGTIVLHCKDGSELEFKEVENIFYTLDNILADDWEIANGVITTSLEVSTFTFGEAIRKLKNGQKVARKGWNGKGMYLWLKPAAVIKEEWCRDPYLIEAIKRNGGDILALGTISMYTHDSTGRNAILTGWLASQSDILSEDWYIVE